MRDEHIISLLDSDRFGSLSESETLRVEGHFIHCDDCRHAYAATRVTAVLLKERSAATIDPSPFFSTRVMSLVREQQSESPFDLVNLWNTARSSLLSAFSVVLLLAGLTFLVPNAGPNDPTLALAQPFYSTEGVLFGDEASRLADSPDDEQVMDEVLSPEEADAGSQK